MPHENRAELRICDRFYFGEVRMCNGVTAAVFVTAIIASASVVATENSKATEWPTGDVWISEPAPLTALRAGDETAVLALAPLQGTVVPDGKSAAPMEFKFDIKLTIRGNDISVHAARSRRSSEFVHRGNGLHHKFHPAAGFDRLGEHQ